MLNKSQLSLQALPSRQLADYLILYIIYSSNDLELLSNSFALNLKENTLEQAQVLGTGSKFGHSAQCRILLTQTSKYLTRKYISQTIESLKRKSSKKQSLFWTPVLTYFTTFTTFSLCPIDLFPSPILLSCKYCSCILSRLHLKNRNTVKLPQSFQPTI